MSMIRAERHFITARVVIRWTYCLSYYIHTLYLHDTRYKIGLSIYNSMCLFRKLRFYWVGGMHSFFLHFGLNYTFGNKGVAPYIVLIGWFVALFRQMKTMRKANIHYRRFRRDIACSLRRRALRYYNIRMIYTRSSQKIARQNSASERRDSFQVKTRFIKTFITCNWYSVVEYKMT